MAVVFQALPLDIQVSAFSHRRRGLLEKGASLVLALAFQGSLGGFHLLDQLQVPRAFFFEMGGELLLLLGQRVLPLVQTRFLFEQGGLLGCNRSDLNSQGASLGQNPGLDGLLRHASNLSRYVQTLT